MCWSLPSCENIVRIDAVLDPERVRLHAAGLLEVERRERQWIFEGLARGRYHIVERRGPVRFDYGDGGRFHAAMRWLLECSGLSVPPEDILMRCRGS
jgi:hypothetical protein